MKRFSAAALAATTALSLAVVPAEAQQMYDLAGKPVKGFGHDSSSQVTDDGMGWYTIGALNVESEKEGAGLSPAMMALGSSEAVKDTVDFASSDSQLSSDFVGATMKNDANEGYKLGTTYAIATWSTIALVIAGVLGGVGYAYNEGLIPGLPR